MRARPEIVPTDHGGASVLVPAESVPLLAWHLRTKLARDHAAGRRVSPLMVELADVVDQAAKANRLDADRSARDA